MQIQLKTWILAIRPKTLTAAVSPVMIGTAMAYGDGVHHIFSAMLCLIAALSIQIGTNLANDYFDFKKGADNEERIGPTRVTQAGLITPQIVKRAFIISFAICVLASYALIQRGGWPITMIMIVSIISGILYTAGPYPLGYVGLGDLFVFIFFGPVAVAGTYYVQSYEMNTAVILAGIAPGLISTAILAVNNYRDIDSDAKSGKRTLAVRFGRAFAQREYLVCILLASVIPFIIFYVTHDHIHILLCSFLPLLAIKPIANVFCSTDGPTLNKTLAYTGKLLLIFSVIFSIGWIL